MLPSSLNSLKKVVLYMSLYIIGNLKCFPFYELTNEIHVFIVQIIAFTRVSLKGGWGGRGVIIKII